MAVAPKQVVLVFIGQASGQTGAQACGQVGGQASSQGGPARLLLGEETMILQGFPIANLPALVRETPNHLLNDLAGNAVSMPVLLALVMSTVSAVDWRRATIHDAPQDSDVEVALEAFNMMLAAPASAEPQGKTQSLTAFGLVRCGGGLWPRTSLLGKVASDLVHPRFGGDLRC